MYLLLLSHINIPQIGPDWVQLQGPTIFMLLKPCA